MEGTLKFATRGSRLALRQFDIISKALVPFDMDIEPFLVESHGERDAETPLYDMKEQGIFVRRLNDMILDGEVEAAVHSAKDIPNEIDPRLDISFFSKRADPRDYFISRESLKYFAGTTGSSSIRRKSFLNLYNRNLRFVNIRGNIDTRIRKWENGEVDSIVVAKAALDRLNISPMGEIISEDICPPDPNQGFVAIVTEKGSEVENKLKKIQDEASLWEAKNERELMVRLQLGCNVAASIRAIYPEKRIKFAYANDEKRFDFSYVKSIEESDIKKLRDIIGS